MRYTQQARKSRVSAVVENYDRYRNYDDLEDVDYEHSGHSGGRGGRGRHVSQSEDNGDGPQTFSSSDDRPVVHLSEHEYDHSQERYSSSHNRPHPSRDPRH